MELSDIYIFRMTHIKNIPHILENGITHKKSINANSNYVAIGNTNLINMRDIKKVNITNGERFQLFEEIVLGNFIPFYFDVRMPMLFAIQHGNGVEKVTPKTDIVYLVCSVKDIVDSDVIFYFSDGHAIAAYTSFYNKSKIKELENIIDWNAVKSDYWGGEENNEIKRKKEAEFLVADEIKTKKICYFICYDETSKQRLMNFGVENNKIKIDKKAYY